MQIKMCKGKNLKKWSKYGRIRIFKILLFLRFEHLLEEALSSDYEPRPSHSATLEEDSYDDREPDQDEEVSEEDDTETMMTDDRSRVYKELVPIIGYVSPR